jgi:hypothetical protein
MKLNYNFLFLLTILTVTFTACKKQNNESNNENLSGKLHKITSNGNNLAVFSYDGAGKLIKKEIDNGGGQVLTINYTYDNGKLTKETAMFAGAVAYQYSYTYLQNGKLDKCYIDGVNPPVYWQMYYDGNAYINYAIKIDGGGESKKMTFDYNSDNIVEATLYDQFGGWQQEKRFEFEYDNKHNPMQELGIPFSEVIDENADLLSPNNTTRIKEYDDNNILVNDSQYQYTYNADQYPTTAIEDNTIQYQFIYY